MNIAKLCGVAETIYAPIVAGASRLQSLFLLAIRLYWGWQFFVAGRGKFLNLEKAIGFFSELHIPLPRISAVAVSSLETVGGLMLLAGLASRPVSLLLAITMVVAYLTADIQKVQAIFSNPDQFVTADEFPFLYTVLVILIFGPGKISLDYIIGKTLCRTTKIP